MNTLLTVLAALIAALIAMGGYALHLRGQVERAEILRAHAAARAAQAEGAVADAGTQVQAIGDRLDQIVEAQRQHVAAVAHLRRHYAELLDLIRAQPDDGCLDRAIPDRLRPVPNASAPAAARDRRRVHYAPDAVPAAVARA